MLSLNVLAHRQKRSIFLGSDRVSAVDLYDCGSSAGDVKIPPGWTVPYGIQHVRWKKGKHPEVIAAGSVYVFDARPSSQQGLELTTGLAASRCISKANSLSCLSMKSVAAVRFSAVRKTTSSSPALSSRNQSLCFLGARERTSPSPQRTCHRSVQTFSREGRQRNSF